MYLFNMKLSLIFELIIFFQLFLIAKFQATIRSLPLNYPTLLTLENDELILVNQNGIHFFDSKLVNEYSDKFIPFSENITSNTENKKTTMAQFTPENGGYILIIAKDILYIFGSDGSKIHSLPINEYFTSTNYYITPYKKEEENYLYYIISYKDDVTKKSIKINYFKFDLNSPFKNEKLTTINLENGNELFGFNCIFMTPLISSGINYDILTCFYCSSQNIYTSSFDPKNNFEKLDSFDYSTLITSVSYTSYIGGIANNSKKKALLYVLGESKPLYMTFDFQNLFSKETLAVCSEYLDGEPFLIKLNILSKLINLLLFLKILIAIILL